MFVARRDRLLFSTENQPHPTNRRLPVLWSTPDFKATGKILVFNNQARFAIVNFPFGAMPKPDQCLAVYRKGLKVESFVLQHAKREQCRCGFDGRFCAEG